LRILLPENIGKEIDLIDSSAPPESYAVLDYSTQDDVDFRFMPLYFGDSFSRPAASLKIGPYRLQVPLDWSVVIADSQFGILEVLEISKLNDRDFETFIFNPISGYAASFLDIVLEDTYPDVAWTTPKLRQGHFLAIPLTKEHRPPCAYFIRETTRMTDALDISKIIP
jgi:hypothetical protein